MKRIIGYDYFLVLFGLTLFNGFTLSNIFSCDSKYWITAVLPIMYLAGYVIWGMIAKDEAVLLKKMVMILMCVKIDILPCLVIMNEGFDTSKYNNHIIYNIEDAVLIQLLEYAIVLSFITFVKWPNTSIETSLNTLRGSETFYSRKIWNILGLIILLVVIVIIIYPSYLNELRPIIFLNESAELNWRRNSSNAMNSIPAIIYYPFNWLFLQARLALAYMIIVWIKNNISGSNRTKVYLSIITIFLLLIVFVPDAVATSLYSAIALLLLLIVFYPTYRNRIIIALLGVSSLIVGYSFIIKPIISSSSFDLNYCILKINAYFSGYINTSAAVEMTSYNASKVDYFIGDFLRALPVLRGFFVSLPRTTELFNIALGRDLIYNSQIIPLEGQGNFYLSYIGVILFTLIHVFTLRAFYKRTINANNSFSYYLFGLSSILLVFGLVMYDLFLNFQLLISQLPLFFVNYLFSKKGNII